MQKLLGLIRRCADDYHMIEAGDHIAVGVSGGKDSLTLLLLLAKRIRSKRGPKGGKPEKEKAPRKEKKGGKAAVDASTPADELDTPISETDVP